MFGVQPCLPKLWSRVFMGTRVFEQTHVYKISVCKGSLWALFALFNAFLTRDDEWPFESSIECIKCTPF